MNDADIDLSLFAEMLGAIDWTKHLGLARIVHGAILRAFMQAKPRQKRKPQGRPPILSTAVKQQVRERYANGEAIHDLARHYRVAQSTIYRTVRNLTQPS